MNPGMLNKLKKMQRDMMEAQKKLEATVFTGGAGGGAVTIDVKGNRQVVGVKIDREFIQEKEDFDMLEDALLAAFNDAMSKVDQATETTMAPFAGGLGGFGF